MSRFASDLSAIEVLVAKVAQLEARVAALEAERAARSDPHFVVPMPCGRKVGGAART